VPARTILLLDSDPEAGASIDAILSVAGYTITLTADTNEAFARAAEHELVIIDMTTGPKSAVDICREIRATPAMAAVPVLCVSSRIDALQVRFHRSRDLAPLAAADGLAPGRTRRTVAVYSPKGGVGTTTIAVNIAVAAVASRPDRVVLVDMARQFGGVATHLNLDLKRTLADVVRDDSALREPELLRTYAMRHGSGLHVLAAAATPESAETITPVHVAQILSTLLRSYDLVVVDAGSTLDERALTIFEAAERVILPVYPEMAGLNAMHALLEYLAETGSVGMKSTVVLNYVFARDILKVRDVESGLGAKVAFELPYDPFLYLKAVNEGVPIVVGAPRSAPAEGLVRLSASAFGADDHAVSAEATEKKGGGLFRRRR